MAHLIPVTFVLTTLLLLPLVAGGFAIANNAPPARLLEWLVTIGMIVVPANLLLIVVAGSARGTPRDDLPSYALRASSEMVSVVEATPTDSMPPSEDTLPASSEPGPSESGQRDALVIAAGVTVILLILGGAFSGLLTPHRQQATSLPSPMAPLPSGPPVRSKAQEQMQVESNGMTKYTNDFLHKLQESSASRK